MVSSANALVLGPLRPQGPCWPHLDCVGLVAHLPDLRHVAHLLLHQGGLEGHQHGECEDAVVPVLIQAPESHAEHLPGNAMRERLLRTGPIPRAIPPTDSDPQGQGCWVWNWTRVTLAMKVLKNGAGEKGWSFYFTWNTKKGAVALSLNSSEKSGTTISALQETRPQALFVLGGLGRPHPDTSTWGHYRLLDRMLHSATVLLLHWGRHANWPWPSALLNPDEASEWQQAFQAATPPNPSGGW